NNNNNNNNKTCLIIYISIMLHIEFSNITAFTINYDYVQRVGEKYFVSYKDRGSFSMLALPQNTEENDRLSHFFGNFEVDMENRPLKFDKWAVGQPDRSVQDTEKPLRNYSFISCTVNTTHSFYFLISI
uniref:Uncharacterized protein n=1 Tax=Sphaeramia orbicularis TaxID=375764 RepID=A0A673AMV4_9TELE